jgi:predicted DCC family thiol-disulfide oxidoreductase YuxK
LTYVFMIVPNFIRNLVYDFIAKNRTKWFGKTESCWVMTNELSDRFL